MSYSRDTTSDAWHDISAFHDRGTSASFGLGARRWELGRRADGIRDECFRTAARWSVMSERRPVLPGSTHVDERLLMKLEMVGPGRDVMSSSLQASGSSDLLFAHEAFARG
jgi:hypothetical protein